MIRAIIINIFLVGSLLSQDSSSFRFGVKAGFNFSYITGAKRMYSSNLNQEHSKFGLNFGIIADKIINPMLSYQFELLYNEMGSKWGQPLIHLGYDGDYAIYNLKYLTLSVQGKLTSRIGDLLKDFDFVIGAAYSFNIGANQSWIVEYPSDYEFDVGPSDIRDKINKHEFGFIYGIKIPISHRQYYLSLLFYNALTTLYSETSPYHKDDFSSKTNMRNNSLSICFDLFF